MNTRTKGNRVQLRCIKELTESGYLVDKVEKTGLWIKQKDLFGLFDLIALSKHGGVQFIQVTCNRPHTHRPYLKFSRDWVKTDISFEQWVWIDRKGWKKWQYYNGEKHLIDAPK